jgi:pimeloyl-ACP methyl ester carboxylesterase
VRGTAGASLPLDVERRGQGPPLVFLHGFGASRFTFRTWADDLARANELHLIDLFGCGAAPPPADGRYGPVEQAEVVTRYLCEADLRGVTLIGHSLGGGVALLAAHRLHELGQADRLVGLVNVAGPAYAQAIPRYIALARLPLIGTLLLRALGPDRVTRAVLRSILFDPDCVTDLQVEGYAAPMRNRSTRRALVATARQIVPDHVDDLVAGFGDISTPTLLLWGRHDQVIPLWVGKRLAHSMQHAQLVVLERCGHVPPEECPQESLVAVQKFLLEIGA